MKWWVADYLPAGQCRHHCLGIDVIWGEQYMNEHQNGRLRARWRRSTRAILAAAAATAGTIVLAIGLTVGTAAADVSLAGSGSLNAAPAATTVSSVAAGNTHTCAIGT